MNRLVMIDKLIDDDIATIKSGMANNDFKYLSNCLLYGTGYSSWTDEELRQEYNDRTWENV